MTQWVHVGPRDAIACGSVRIVELPRDAQGRPREAVVVLDGTGTVRAYLNRCRHLPIPLDAGSRVLLDACGRHFRCGTHGALYRLEDGVCVAGPCLGAALVALELRVRDDGTLEVAAPDT
jgi:nitrite reductase/ring-hydroxylating ferredoxin subunit